MAAYWNLICTSCDEPFDNVQCSMYSIPACPKCGGERHLRSSRMMTLGTGIFPFTCPHVDGKPMEITSLKHLRQVERDYGVAFSAFSKANINDLDEMKNVPTYRGDDPEFIRSRGRR